MSQKIQKQISIEEILNIARTTNIDHFKDVLTSFTQYYKGYSDGKIKYYIELNEQTTLFLGENIPETYKIHKVLLQMEDIYNTVTKNKIHSLNAFLETDNIRLQLKDHEVHSIQTLAKYGLKYLSYDTINDKFNPDKRKYNKIRVLDLSFNME